MINGVTKVTKVGSLNINYFYQISTLGSNRGIFIVFYYHFEGQYLNKCLKLHAPSENPNLALLSYPTIIRIRFNHRIS